MTSGELLKQLFRSYATRRDEDFRATALKLIAEEQEKNHHVLAADLERILNNGLSSASPAPASIADLPRDRERSALLMDVRTPSTFLEEMVLADDVHKKASELIEEYRRGELLKTHGLRARSKLLLCGPPGCGKTMCAEVFASELGLPMLYVRFDAVVSSFLGETSANIRKVFDYAARGTWVLFFDEFDAIGKSREDITEHGELKRVINSFLQILDGFQSESLVIAATNHEGLLDRALWRRFDDILYFDKPTLSQIRKLLKRKLANFPHEEIDFQSVARKLRTFSHADIERVCLNAIRYCIVNDHPAVTGAILTEAAVEEKKRLRLSSRAQMSRGK